MIVAVSEPELEYTGRFDWVNDEGEGWDLSNDTLKLSTVKFNIKGQPRFCLSCSPEKIQLWKNGGRSHEPGRKSTIQRLFKR